VIAQDLPEDEPTTPLLVKDKGVAELFQISRREVWRLTSAGVLPAPVKLGGSTRWRYVDLESLVEELNT